MDITDRYVNINIVDPKKFLDVAGLVDRDDFITDMIVLRKKWKVIKPYQKKKNQSWSKLPPFKELVPKEKDVLKKVNEMEELVQFMKDMFVLKDNPVDDLKHKEQVMCEFRKKESWKRFPDLYFQHDVMKLRRSYQKSPNFDQIIICSVVYATVVMADDYKTCEIGLRYQGEALWQPFHEPKPTISFYPLVKPEEILELFRKEGEKVLTQYQKEYIKGLVFDHDTISLFRN